MIAVLGKVPGPSSDVCGRNQQAAIPEPCGRARSALRGLQDLAIGIDFLSGGSRIASLARVLPRWWTVELDPPRDEGEHFGCAGGAPVELVHFVTIETEPRQAKVHEISIEDAGVR